jgi:hypothetical protein
MKPEKYRSLARDRKVMAKKGEAYNINTKTLYKFISLIYKEEINYLL